MPSQHLIFVYGTLKRRFCRAHFLAGQNFLCEARTQPKYRMFNCGTYPGICTEPAHGVSITGELWLVDAECLRRLDVEEGVTEQLYARRVIELAPPLPDEIDSLTVDAYFYLPTSTGFPDCGDTWM